MLAVGSVDFMIYIYLKDIVNYFLTRKQESYSSKTNYKATQE